TRAFFAPRLAALLVIAAGLRLRLVGILALDVVAVVETLRFAELDVRLEAGQVGLDRTLHEAEPRSHLLDHPARVEVDVQHHPREMGVELVEGDHAGVRGPFRRLPRAAVVLPPLGDLDFPPAAAEPDLLLPRDLVSVLL